MDDRRFDELTRSLAGGASRRGVLRGLAASAAAVFGLGRVQRASAQTTALPLGAACSDAGQCSQTGGAVLCADNGYADDGALNCCRGAGGACADVTFSADCCSGLYCRGGVCTDLSASGELPLGSYCTETAQCSQTNGPVVCGENGVEADGALNCCREAGGTCGSDAVCCGGNACVDGVCGGVTFGDLAAGAVCTETVQCSQAAGATVCADNGYATDGALNCCRLETVACARDAECCANLLCGDNGVGVDGGLNCCAPIGGACTSDYACCGTNFCVNGVCQTADA